MSNITYLIAVASMIGTIANSFQKKWCFYIWGVTNTFWIAYNIYLKQYAQAMLYSFNLITCALGILKWKKNK